MSHHPLSPTLSTSPARLGRSLALAALLSATLLTPALAAEPQSPREAVISVSGEGRATMVPDMAVLSLSVVKDAATAGEALAANNEAMAAVLASLKEGGIEDRDLQTSGFSINPQYRYPDNSDGQNRPPELIGYQVQNMLTVRLRDLSKLGALIDRSVTLGINQANGIQFTNDKPEAAIAEARKAAVADALDKARTMAEAAGVKVGRIVELSEGGPSRPEPMPVMRAMAKEMASDAVPVATGENAYAITVNVVVAIDQ